MSCECNQTSVDAFLTRGRWSKRHTPCAFRNFRQGNGLRLMESRLTARHCRASLRIRGVHAARTRADASAKRADYRAGAMPVNVSGPLASTARESIAGEERLTASAWLLCN